MPAGAWWRCPINRHRQLLPGHQRRGYLTSEKRFNVPQVAGDTHPNSCRMSIPINQFMIAPVRCERCTLRIFLYR